MRKYLPFLLGITGLSFLAISPAPAADIVTRRPAPATVTAPAFNWTGFYVGLNAGYGWAEQDLTLNGAAAATFSARADGFVGGGQAGYNWQFSNVVFGIEADIQWANLDGDSNGGFLIGATPFGVVGAHTTDWFGTVRGRLGLTWGNWLGYITGGWAYGGTNGDAVVTGPGVVLVTSDGRSRTDGWTIGGGIESMFAPNWSARLEYLFIRFPGETATFLTGGGAVVTASTNDFDAHVVRVGINYHFR
jgi:outer membrane immunogenic protein